MDYFKLIRVFFDFAFENPEKIKPNHIALYSFCVEHCNRLGWKQKFGLPTTMAKDAIGIRSYNTYISALNDLVEFGFIVMLEKSKNQYSANIIALSGFNKALDKALDKALIKHSTKQSESTVQSIDSIDKQYTSIQINQLTKYNKEIKVFLKTLEDDKFNFKNSLLDLGIEKQIVNDWLKVRKDKKASNTETAFNAIKLQIEKSNLSAADCIKKAVENSWAGFKADWLNKNQSGKKDHPSILRGGTVYEQF